MLQQIKRDPAIGIDRDDLAVDERTGRQSMADFGDRRKLRREIVSSARPQSHTGGVFPGDTAIAVELDLVEPARAFGELADRKRIHGFDEVDFDRQPSRHAGMVTAGKWRF